MVVPEKFHKPERNEYNAFPGNAISFISYLVVQLFRRQRSPTCAHPFFPRVPAKQNWNQIRISEMEHRTKPQRPASDRNLRQDSASHLCLLHFKHELPCSRHLRSQQAHQNVNILSYIIISLIIVSKTEAFSRGLPKI